MLIVVTDVRFLNKRFYLVDTDGGFITSTLGTQVQAEKAKLALTRNDGKCDVCNRLIEAHMPAYLSYAFNKSRYVVTHGICCDNQDHAPPIAEFTGEALPGFQYQKETA